MLLENGLESCNCRKKSCERHGKCEQCLEYHTKNPKYPPYCKRKKSGTSNILKTQRKDGI